MRRTFLVAALVLFGVTGCGGTHLDAQVAKRLAVAKASHDPAFWLGARYDGLNLVHVESGSDAFFASSLWYADCSWFELNTFSLRCHRNIEVDNDVPAPGEISTMGRCIFSTSVHGVTVATFPVNPGDLRVFGQGATILVSARSRSESLRAIAALRPLNGHPLVHRDVSGALGTCKAPAPKAALHLSAKQRYERQMKRSFFVAAVGGLNLNAVNPHAAEPQVLQREFVSNAKLEAALLRNLAIRVGRVRPPAAVAAEHRRLVTELRVLAAVVDRALDDVQRDGADAELWAADTRTLQPQMTAATSAIARTLQAFKAAGYSIYVKPSGD